MNRLRLAGIPIAVLAACQTWRVEPIPKRASFDLAPTPAREEGKGFLGLEVVANESESLEDLRFLPGVRVAAVVPNSPAEKAGLAVSDVVLEVDGAAVDSPGAFRAIEAAAEPGRNLRLEVQRQDRILETEIVVEPRAAAAPLLEIARVEEEKARLRVRDRAVESAAGRRIAVEIVSFLEESPFERAGLRPGDLLLSLEGRALGSAARFVARVREECAPGATVRVAYAREGRTREARVRLRAPRRMLTALRLPPLFAWERDPRADRTRWWIGDFLLFSLVRRDRRGAETEVRILGLFGWKRGEGMLGEGAP